MAILETSPPELTQERFGGGSMLTLAGDEKEADAQEIYDIETLGAELLAIPGIAKIIEEIGLQDLDLTLGGVRIVKVEFPPVKDPREPWDTDSPIHNERKPEEDFVRLIFLEKQKNTGPSSSSQAIGRVAQSESITLSDAKTANTTYGNEQMGNKQMPDHYVELNLNQLSDILTPEMATQVLNLANQQPAITRIDFDQPKQPDTQVG